MMRLPLRRHSRMKPVEVHVWEPRGAPSSDSDEERNPYLELGRPTTLYKAFYRFPPSGQNENLGDLAEGSGFERPGLFEFAVRWAQHSVANLGRSPSV